MEILDFAIKRRINSLEKLVSRRKKLSVINMLASANDSVKELKRNKKMLLLKTNKNRFTISNRGSINLSEDQVKTILSMLPDEVINFSENFSESREFTSSVFFADVSGFTDLSDRYQRVENGASKLSVVLNNYMGSMVQEIISHGGDILKFGGDAFIAIFRAESDAMLQEVIRKAIDSALIIQANCRNWRTDIGIILNVKISISGGTVLFSNIGNEKSAHYAVLGEPVWQAKSLQDCIRPGEVLVTQKTWLYMDELLYKFRVNRELKFTSVEDFKDNLAAMQRQQEATLALYEREKKNGERGRDLSKTSTSAFQFSFSAVDVPSIKVGENFVLRAVMNKFLDNRSKRMLRRFLIPPLMKLIDFNDPVEFLTEMRDVVIVFVNFVVPKSSSEELVEILNRIYNTMTTIVTLHEGIVNKVSLFDKDMMFLVVFGLRGFKHELESRIGLRCASEIHGTFKTWKGVSTVSVGVTSGMSYCGVVGHTLRREYTVISVTVNRAARLMMAYPGIVSCDQETVLSSKLDIKHFKLLPVKYLKGLRGKVIAYDFREVMFNRAVEDLPIYYDTPLLGRDFVMQLARKLLLQSIWNHNLALRKYSSKTSCLVVKGGSQEGKTRIMNSFLLICVQEKIRYFNRTMQTKDINKPYGFIRKFFENIFKTDVPLEDEIIRRLPCCDEFLHELLCAFNPIFGTKFEETQVFKQLSEDDIVKVTELLLKLVSRKYFENFLVVLIDDIELMDRESFMLLPFMFENDSTFTYLSLGTHRKLSPEMKKILNEPYVTTYFVEELNVMSQNALACQCLKVEALNVEFEMYLHENSNGNPGWIQTFVQSMQQSSKLDFETMTTREARNKGFIVIKDQEYSKNLFQNCWYEDGSGTDAENEDEKIRVAIMTELPQRNEFIRNTKTDRDLLFYDSLTSYEQLVCKSASVLGTAFSRAMLSTIMNSSTERMISKAMVKLFEHSIFVCTSTIGSNDLSKRKKTSGFVNCSCRNLKVFQSCRDLPDYSCCSHPRFKREDFRRVVYGSLTEKQLTDYHQRALTFLLFKTRKCAPCGCEKFPMLMSQDEWFKDGYRLEKDQSFERMVEYFDSFNIPVRAESKKFSINNLLKRKLILRPVALNFVNYNYSNCQCIEILHATFIKIIQHCYHNRNILNLVDAKVALAELCFEVNNLPHSKNLARLALGRLENYEKDIFDEESRYSEYLKARALAFESFCHEKLKNRHHSLKMYSEAFSVLGVSFPKTNNFRSKILKQKISLEIRWLVWKKKLPKVSRIDGMTGALTSKVFSKIFQLLWETKDYELAKLAALWGLRQALLSDRNLDDIATSFENLLKAGDFSRCINYKWLTKASLEEVSRAVFLNGLDLQKLKRVVHFYRAMMETHGEHYNYRDAITFGNFAFNLCIPTRIPEYAIKIVPHLFLLKMNLNQLSDAETLLVRFYQFAKSSGIHEGLIWFHALCMDFLLDTGFVIQTYEACVDFFMDSITIYNRSDCPDAFTRLVSNLFLWSVRHQIPEMVCFWAKHLPKNFELAVENQVDLIFIAFRMIESVALQEIEIRSDTIFGRALKLKQLMELSKNAIKRLKFPSERFEMLEMYLSSITSRSKVSIKKIQELENQAYKNRNLLAYAIIRHNRMSWSKNLPAEIENFWITHSSSDNYIKLHEISTTGRIFPFTLFRSKI